MRRHSDAIKKIRQTLKTLVGEKVNLRKEIHALKFDGEGKRRPETGPKRHSLKESYNWHTRPEARATLVAYGLLRGVPYAKMEPKTESGVQLSRVLKALHEAIGDNEALKADWTMDRVCKLILDGVDPLASSEAA
jgi:hypothetical protein